MSLRSLANALLTFCCLHLSLLLVKIFLVILKSWQSWEEEEEEEIRKGKNTIIHEIMKPCTATSYTTTTPEICALVLTLIKYSNN